MKVWPTSLPEVLLVEPRPRLGLVRELIFNLFSHQLHRLLGASTTVTKTPVLGSSSSREPGGVLAQPASRAAHSAAVKGRSMAWVPG